MKLKQYGNHAFGVLAASAFIGATLAAAPASAAVTNITSSSTILDVASNIGNVGPELPAAGSAPPAYNVTNSFGSYSTTIGPISFSTGVLVDTASGDIKTATGTASSSLASLDIEADSFFSLKADALSSTSSVDGTPSATGFTTLANLALTVLGTPISINADPSPNDMIFDEFGVKVTLNQQIKGVEGGFGESITTSAIAVDLDLDILGVKGAIDIAQSKASISEAAVPEPSTWAMTALGFVALAFAYRRAQKVAAIA